MGKHQDERILVTTALEETWPKDNVPILYLGHWCRIFSKKPTRIYSDTKTVAYHWDDRQKLKRDYIYVDHLYKNILIRLGEKLNRVHGVNRPNRYWSILIGPWLKTFLAVFYDRWCCVEAAFVEENIVATSVVGFNWQLMVPNEFNEFDQLATADEWNHYVFCKIIEFVDYPVTISDISTDRPYDVKKSEPVVESRKLSNSFKSFVNKLLGIFQKDHGIFLYQTYLPRSARIRLELSLGQVPQNYPVIDAPISTVDPAMRCWKLEHDSYNQFEKFVVNVINQFIPTIYLEGYDELVSLVSSLAWPKLPSLIWTSNAHYRNEVFKAWMADKVVGGAALVIGQHGGGIGSVDFAANEDHEIDICDRYLSWGWVHEGKNKVIPIGRLKNVVTKPGEDQPRDDLVLVTFAKARYSQMLLSYPLGSQWLDYHFCCEQFVKALSIDIQANTIVRLYAGNDVCQEERWENQFPSMRLSNANTDLTLLLDKARLVVSTYNGATMLETLGAGIPTVIFWDPKYFELRPRAIEYFTLLQDAGILFKDPLDAASHVRSIWNDVGSWWLSPCVQEAIKKFCEQYSKTNSKLVTTIKRELLTVSTATKNILH